MINYILNTKDKIAGIYAIRNLMNGKIYIGQSKDLRHRLIAHISLSKNINKNSQIIHKAIYKYGEENFVFYPLVMERNVSRNRLNNLEKDIINQFKQNGFQLYNIAEGGFAGDLGEDVRRKISEKLKGRKFSKEWREKISKALKGKKRPKEQIKKAKLTYKYRLENGMYKSRGPNNPNNNKTISHPEKSHEPWNKGLTGEEYKKHFKKYRIQ